MIDLIFCLPIVFGCPTKIKPFGNQAGRVCPHCNNAAMFSAKSRKWLELCFVPLIPMKAEHVWMCGICQLKVPMQPQPGWEPPIAATGYQHPQQAPGYYMSPQHSGYQPQK